MGLGKDLMERVAQVADGSTLDQKLLELVAPLNMEREELLALKTELKGAERHIDRHVKRIDRMVKAAGVAQTVEKPARKKRTGQGHAAMPAQWRIDQVVAHLDESEDPKTVKMMSKELGWKEGSTQNAVLHAHRGNLIRLVKNERNTNFYGSMKSKNGKGASAHEEVKNAVSANT